MTEQNLHDYNKWLTEVWSKQYSNIPFMIDAPKAYLKYRTKQLIIPSVVVSETELCENPHCEDGIVDSDMYGHPIYCQVCDKHN